MGVWFGLTYEIQTGRKLQPDQFNFDLGFNIYLLSTAKPNSKSPTTSTTITATTYSRLPILTPTNARCPHSPYDSLTPVEPQPHSHTPTQPYSTDADTISFVLPWPVRFQSSYHAF